MDDLKEIIQSLQGVKTYLASQAIKESDAVAREALVKSQQVVDDVVRLLKPVEPVRDPKCGRVWLCGNCGQFVGFEDNDPSNPNEYDHFCRSCGKAVKWDE